MRARERLAHEHGWTMIEVQIVMVIMGILSTVAGPSFLNFMDEANKVAAASNVHSALPAVEGYFLDNGSYLGMDTASGGQLGSGLQSYDPGIKVSVDAGQAQATTYCIYSTVGGFTYFKRGPMGGIVQDPTPDVSPCS